MAAQNRKAETNAKILWNMLVVCGVQEQIVTIFICGLWNAWSDFRFAMKWVGQLGSSWCFECHFQVLE